MNNQKEELKGIITKFAEWGWGLIDAPSKAWLSDNNEVTNSELINAVKQADLECGSCGCELDLLYKRALQLL